MSSYRGTAEGPDRAKAIAGVLAVHLVLAFIIVSGLNVRMVQRAVERLTTITIREPPPPPPARPSAMPLPRPAMKQPEGAPAKRAEPSPVVAPPPKLPLSSPVVAAKIAGTGTAPTSGSAVSGNGAGGNGNGPGAGGNDFSGYTPARRISRIPDHEYGELAATGLRAGSVGVTIRVNPDGSVSNCRVARSSGNGYADALMCQLTLRYIRFDPARDPAGRAVAQDVTFFPNWWKP